MAFPYSQKLIRGAALLAFTTLFVIGYAFCEQTQYRPQIQAMVTKTQQVDDRLDVLFSDLQDAESGQRGYLLTADPEYLDSYNKAVRVLPGVFTMLHSNTALGDPRVQKGLVRLQALSEAKLTELKQTIDLTMEGRIGDADQLVQTNQGKALMDAIRQQMANLKACVKADYDRRVQHLNDLDHDIFLTTVYGGILSLGLLGACFILLNLEVKRRVQSGQALLKAEEQARHAQQRLELALEAAGIAAWEQNLKTGETWLWNETAPMQAHDQNPPRSFQELADRVAVVDRSRLLEDQQRVLRGQEMVRGEYRLTGNNEEPYWLVIRMRAFKGAYGTSLLLAGVIMDITEQKRAQENLKQTQMMLQMVLDHIPQRIFWKDKHSIYQGGNRLWLKDTGFENPFGKSDFEMPWKELAESYRASDLETMRTGEAKVNFEEPLVIPDGSRRWLRTSKIPLRDPSGEVAGVLGAYEDITEAKRLEQALMESEHRYRVAAENAPIGQGLVDMQGRWLQVNPALCQMLGYSEEELLVRSFLDITYPDDQGISEEAYQSMLSGETDTCKFEKRHLHRTGRTTHVLIHGALVRDNAGKPQYFICQIIDMTERKQMEAQLQEMAHYDVLTGLPNRRLFRDRLQQAVSRCHRNKKPAALMYLDIDHFKAVNDTFGHDAGDALLIAFASRLKAAVRETDTAARLGGDEFTVIVEDLRDAQSAFLIADKILEKMQGAISLGDSQFHISTSIGISFFDGQETNIDVLLKQADHALYEAKKAGRSRYKSTGSLPA